MKAVSKIEIVDITRDAEYEKHIYRCLAPMPFKRYAARREYLSKAIPKGFHKKLLLLDRRVVGQIEYAPAGASGYPISGSNVIVLNCVWVLRRAGSHNFGRMLIDEMIRNAKDAAGFATIALENHWSPWFVKWQMEKLGFRSLDSIKVTHKAKRKDHSFNIHLMWMPVRARARPPTWDKQKLLEGETFCLAHPLYHPQAWNGNILVQRKNG